MELHASWGARRAWRWLSSRLDYRTCSRATSFASRTVFWAGHADGVLSQNAYVPLHLIFSREISLCWAANQLRGELDCFPFFGKSMLDKLIIFIGDTNINALVLHHPY